MTGVGVTCSACGADIGTANRPREAADLFAEHVPVCPFAGQEPALMGATVLAPEGQMIADAGQFAARWNHATPAQREQFFTLWRDASSTSWRCWAEQHEALGAQIGYLQGWAFEASRSAVQYEDRHGWVIEP